MAGSEKLWYKPLGVTTNTTPNIEIVAELSSLKPNTFANFEVPAKIAHRNFFFAILGVVNQKKI
jgi:hypothetical protein